MIILVILLVIIILWLQYPTYKKSDEDKPSHIKIFNLIKSPVVAICFILIIFSTLMCVKKTDLDVYLSIPKY